THATERAPGGGHNRPPAPRPWPPDPAPGAAPGAAGGRAPPPLPASPAPALGPIGSAPACLVGATHRLGLHAGHHCPVAAVRLVCSRSRIAAGGVVASLVRLLS